MMMLMQCDYQLLSASSVGTEPYGTFLRNSKPSSDKCSCTELGLVLRERLVHRVKDAMRVRYGTSCGKTNDGAGSDESW